MPTNFPNSIDTYANPTASTWEDDPGFEHDKVHSNVHDAIRAIEAKIGIDGSDAPSSLDYLIKNTVGGHNHDGSNSRLDAHRSVTTGAHAASAISIVDAGNYYAGNNTEAVLQEVGSSITSINSTLNALPGYIYKFKAADQSVINSTTLVDDDTLFFPMNANTKYLFELVAFATFGSSGDFKYRHAGPVSPNLVIIRRNHDATNVAGTPAIDTAYSSTDATILVSANASALIRLHGIIYNGSTSGNFQFKWAQNTADASVAAVVKAGSYLWYKVLS